MENYRELFETILNKKFSDIDARSYLERITREYPFFTPAQFLLLQQTEKTDTSYSQQLMKTAAGFNNNYWLNYLLLQEDKAAFMDTFSAEETIADSHYKVYTETTSSDDQPMQETQVAIGVQEETSTADALTADADSITQEKINETGTEIQAAVQETSTQEEQAEIIDTVETKAIADEELLIETPATSNVLEEPVAVQEVNVAPEAVTETVQEQNTTIESTEIFAEAPVENNVNTLAVEEEVNNTDTAAETASGEEELFNNPLRTDLAEAAAILDTQPVENGPLFEPLHTTDYFASVGIKLSDEIRPGDRLGSQLKSFTEWLKMMKRLQPVESTVVLPEGSPKQDDNIQRLAERSNKEDEIITEAMADVLMQQGRMDKAVEVLKKLSLLNPSKNTYFAAKIDKLKEE